MLSLKVSLAQRVSPPLAALLSLVPPSLLLAHSLSLLYIISLGLSLSILVTRVRPSFADVPLESSGVGFSLAEMKRKSTEVEPSHVAGGDTVGIGAITLIGHALWST